LQSSEEIVTASIRRRSLLKGILGGVAAVAAGGAVASRVEARDTAPTITISGPIAEPVSITNESLHATLHKLSAEPWVTYRGRAADRALRRVEFGPFGLIEHTHTYTIPRLDDLP
jgi:hypothetical protein